MNNHKLRKGFTLVDVLIGGIILGIGLCAMVGLFSHCSLLADTARELTIVMSAAQSKLEEIQSQDYNLIPGLYAQEGSIGNSFSLSQIAGRGCIYIDESNPDLLAIEVVISWRRGRDGDITGEDKNLNGLLDGGEDLNNNAKLDSPAALTIFISRKL